MAVSKKDFIEKFGAILISIIIGGIVGFFSAIMSLKSEINDLRVDLMRLKTQVEENSKQNFKTIQNRETWINKSESNIENIKGKPNPTDNSPGPISIKVVRIELEVEYSRSRIRSKS